MNLLIALLLCCVTSGFCKPDWPTGLKTFSHAVKQAYCTADTEIDLFSHSNGPGVITEQWFTGWTCMGPNTIVRYYVDNDKMPAIEMNLYVGHGIGFVAASAADNNKTGSKDSMNVAEEVREKIHQGGSQRFGSDKGVPWGTRRIGHNVPGGALYNTIRIPFQKSIRVTFEAKGQGTYWYIIRGAENYPIVIGDLTLPKNAMLKLYKHENYELQPLEYIVLASTTNKTGLLYQVTLATSSANYEHLEACFRAQIDDNVEFQYLSSGTEDLFLSAYYYSAGIFHTSHSGLTFIQNPGTMSAYKFFEDDPVAFSKSFKLVWRCGEDFTDNNCFRLSNRDCFVKEGLPYCKNNEGVHEPFKVGKPLMTKMTSYVWMYEW
eukprot:Seg501.6 transcript_id=Seg501.6/GoldUCD/mRNA.D3Y31 product="hypothetical protein" protein_id=Seg501.6/GoldUCD/D3Y31